MPIYEYICSSCEHEFEKIVKNNETEVLCPKCHKNCFKLMSAHSVGAVSKTAQASNSPCQSCLSPNKEKCLGR